MNTGITVVNYYIPVTRSSPGGITPRLGLTRDKRLICFGCLLTRNQCSPVVNCQLSIVNLEYRSKVMPEYWSRTEADVQVWNRSVSPGYSSTLKRAKMIERWLSVMPSHISGTILSTIEFRHVFML